MNKEEQRGVALEVSAAIKKLREEKGLTQGDLFRKTGLERAYVSKLEAGKIIPKLVTIVKLAEAFGITAAEFIRYAEELAKKK